VTNTSKSRSADIKHQVPTQWKVDDVIPIRIRPTLYRILTMTSDQYLLLLGPFNAEWIRDSICQKLDPKQFGEIPGSFPVDALISLLHSLYAYSDGNGNGAIIPT
jgi:hypothetical protein